MPACAPVWLSLLVLGLLGQMAVAAADDVIRAKITAAGDATRHKADAVVVLDETDVTVRPSGIGTARSHVVIKILREPAVRTQGVQVFPFDPHTNRLDLLAVRIYRADGRIEDVALDAKIEQPQAAGSIFWGTRQYLVSLPRLAVGDAVEKLSALTGFNVAYLTGVAGEERSGDGECNALGQELRPPVPGHWHDEVHFWTEQYPILEKRYTVRVPRDKPLQYEVYNGELRPAVLVDGDQVVYSFEKKNLAPMTREPGMEPWPNVGPKLLLATLPSWEDKARWLYEVTEPQLTADDAIRAKVAEIIRDCRTDEEKYTALNHWVAENIRYAGTSRGMCEGYTIHDIKETFHDRCGVCKDKAGMLVGMLRVAGFDAYLVMTMARQRVDRVPADQFNHAVTCIRNPDGSLILLDPTWMPKSRDNWSTLEPQQHVVYGLPEGGGLAQSPDFPPEANQAHWRATSVIDVHGALRGQLEFTANGAPETRLRRGLAALPPDQRNELFEEAFARLSPLARVSEILYTDPVDFRDAIRIACRYEVDGFVLGHSDRRRLALPMLRAVFGERILNDLFGHTFTGERKYGLQLRATRLAVFEESITLPPGWTVTRTPDPIAVDGPAASLSFEASSAPERLEYVCRLTVKRWIVPPEEYANFREVIERFEQLAGPVVIVEVEDSHAQR